MRSNLLSVARDLQRRKARRRRDATVIEGVRLVEEALAAGVTIRGALTTPAFGADERQTALLHTLASHDVSVDVVTERELGDVVDTRTPQGIAAVIDVVRWPLDAVVPAHHAPVLVLDALQDPGNVGAVLRTAWGLGCAGAIALDGTADLANPKVIRAAMGATFRFPTAEATIEDFEAWCRRHAPEVWITDTQGTALDRVTFPEHLAVVVGNEGAGVRPALQGIRHQRIAIPLARGVESLNVVVAAGIVLYEAAHA